MKTSQHSAPLLWRAVCEAMWTSTPPSLGSFTVMEEP